ncbi:MAG: VWA domain-containing protein [Candidatus Zixiibacteriota bacterium]
MKTLFIFLARGRGLSRRACCLRALSTVLPLLLVINVLAPPAAWTAGPGRINLGTDDDPYFVEDSLTAEALKASALSPSPASIAANVVRLGSWTTGLTHTAGVGSSRLLIFAVGYENGSDVGVNAVSYGGQSLTRIGGVAAGTSSIVRTELWYLKEAGITAAGTNTFTVTWGGSAPASPKYGASTYANVNQTTPIGHSAGTSVNSSSPNPITATLNVFAGGMAVADVFCGKTGSYTWNNGYSEGFDQSGSSSNMSAADHSEPATGTSVPSATHSPSPNRHVLFAASLVPEEAASAFDSLNISQLDPSQFPHICTYVEALDQFGYPVGGLTADSFCVYQDNNQINGFTVQQLTLDSCRTATCLVIDVSGSMANGGKMTAAKNAAAQFVRNMDIYDRAAIVKFSTCYTVVQNFTGDTTLLLAAINGLSTGGYTAYFDGVWAGVGLTVPELGSKAVIHLTDGMENNSQNCGGGSSPDGLGDGFADDSALIVNLALGAGIPLYGITLGGSFDPQYVQKLSYATGGAYYNAPTGAQLDAIYTQIKTRLCSRYLICYDSPDTIQNGDCHDVIICHHLGSGQCVDCDTANYCEKAPPVIVRTPATIALDNTCQRWGTTVQLCAYVTDEDTPLNQLTVNLFYRNSGSSPYTSVPTTRTDSTFCASVPGSQLVCGGDSIQYYFTASDGSVTVASPANAPTGHHAFPICPNHAPVCSVPNDTTIFLCNPTSVCLPVSGTDQDNNLEGCTKTAGPGTLSGGQWCYTPSGSETVGVTIRCTDSCGLYCEDSFNVTFTFNATPVCNIPNDTTIFQCTPTQVCLPVSATGNNPVCAITSGPGTLSGGNWCYTPTGDQTVTVTIRCTDACGAYCEKTFHVTFDINDAPVCNIPNDTAFFQCTPTQVCLPVSATDPNGNLTGCAITSGPGTLSGGQWCYTPSGDETVTVTIRCTDACSLYCEKTFHVTFDINDAPVCNIPNDTAFFQCTPTQVCLPVSASDPNGNLTGCAITSGPGTLSGGNWCYTPSGDETVTVTIRCTDACGLYCEKTFHVTFDINDAPVCNIPNDTSFFQCTPTQVCLPVSATDPNGNLTGCAITSGPGILSGGNWCYTPSGDETVTVTIRCTDACSLYCEKTFHVTFNINDAPVCNIPNDTSFFQCTPTQVCLPFSATDPNGNLIGCAITSGPGTLSGGNWCYTPSGDETVTVIIRCTDACGAYCEKTFHVTFDINDAPVCNIPNDTSFFQCTPTQVCLPVSATGNNPVCAITSGPGTLSGGNWCYTPTGDQTVTVTIRCTDACGAYCEKTFHVTFDINDAPVCNIPNDTAFFQCTPTQVCLPVSATDVNGNLTGCTITGGPGILSGGNWCYTPTGDETVTVTVRCTDACGLYCEKTFHVTFDINDPPTIALGDDISLPQTIPQNPVCITYIPNDVNGMAGLIESLVSGPAGTTIDTALNQICFTPPGTGTYTIVAQVVDPCGAGDRDTVMVTIYQTAPPNCFIPNDTTVVQCTAAQLCLPVYATSQHPPVTCVIENGPGTLSGGQWCYTPSGDETVTVDIRCTDTLGVSCPGSFTVVFDINDPPVCSVPNDTTIFQCAPTQVCLPVSATDPNGNLTGCAITNGPGTLSGGNWCYTPSGDETVTVTVRCTDACGSYCEKTFHVTFDINAAPVCTVPNDTTIFQCSPTPVCLPVSATDADGNLTGCTIVSGPGQLNGNWCYTPTGDETVTVTVRCSDACGAFCEKTFNVTFVINDPPVCNVPNDTTIFQCAPAQVCLPVSATDPDGNLTGCVMTGGPGILSGGNWCYTPSGAGTVTVTIRCTDACNAYCEGTFHVTFVIGQPPQITCPGNLAVQCIAEVPPCNPSDATVTGGTGTVTVTCSSTNNGAAGCPGSPLVYTYTYTATDSCGATAQCQRTITVIDDTPPHVVGTCPRDTTIQCGDPIPPPATVTVADNCDPNVTTTFLEQPNLNGCGGNTGTITRRWVSYDVCGNTSVCIQVITIVDTQSPVCNLPTEPVNFSLCENTDISVPVSGTDNCDASVMCWNTSSYGTVVNGSWVYRAWRTESFTVTIRCADECGNTCQSSFNVNIQMNDPPTIAFGSDQSVFQCAPEQICATYTVSDPNGMSGLIEALVSGPAGATIDTAANKVCFTPSGTGAYTIIARITDTCGAADQDMIVYQVTINTPPTISLGNDTTVSQCAPASICKSYTVVDPNNGPLFEFLVAGPPGATINTDANLVCFTPAGSGVYTIIVKVTDSCAASDYDTVNVTVALNTPPTCLVPNDTTVFQCSPTQLCLPVGGSDPEGGPVTCQKINGPGQLAGGMWCYTPTTEQTVTVTVRCTDTCGASCEKSFNVTFDVNSPPVCNVPGDMTIRQNCVPQEVQLPVGGSDVDGNFTGCQIVSGPGMLSNGKWIYTPAGDGQVCVTIRCSDACGASCEKSFCVTFLIDEDNCGCRIIVSLGDNDGTIQTLNGQRVSIPVNFDSLFTDIGGFDLLICYDPSVLVFLGADKGHVIDSLQWEYFTYRYGAQGNCTGGCPSGYLRLVGIANLDNGVTPPEGAYHPIGAIATLTFDVSSDRNLINQCVPINFCWFDCTDNVISSRSGDTTFVESHMAIDTCLSNAKENPVPAICFIGGWICIIEPPDDRGDMNLNGIANEVGDAVLFTNYFIYGDGVWSDVCDDDDPPNCYKDVQILASDVNDDGIVLTVADLIYMIRIITGDAQPYPPGGHPKAATGTVADVRYSIENGMLRVTTNSPVEIGGAHLVFHYSDLDLGTPTLSGAAAAMAMKSNSTADELRIIAYPWERGVHLSAGTHELLSIPVTGGGRIDLTTAELSDASGAVLPVRMAARFVPTEFALQQNYPNPFNAGTVITFDLKDEADWTLAIYNVLGQQVREFNGHEPAGRVAVTWDGTDRSGHAAASGIYFYRLHAASFTATKKMMLVK